MTTSREQPDRESPGCVSFEAALPDYLDETLAPQAADTARAHVATCEACRALVRDLETIRRQAATLPVLQPPRDLWSDIEARIASQPPGSAGLRPASRAALDRWFGPQYGTRVARLAAGLVILTAAMTYLVTRLRVGPVPPPVVSTNPVKPMIESTPHVQPVPTPQQPVVPKVTPVKGDRPHTSEYLYDAQITALRRIVEQRRGQLNPKTLAVIERSLSLIDTAIAQSKAALAKDPANAFLADQVDHDLDTKLELLRTVALLPSHT